MPLQLKVLHMYWALLEIKAFKDFKSVTSAVSCQLYLESRKKHPTSPAKLAEASLLQDGTKPGSSGIFYFQEVVAFPVLNPLSYTIVLKDVSSLLDSLATWRAP